MLPSTEATEFAPNAYIRITPDNVVRLWVTRSEMGQGVRTTLAMMLVEELEADWAAIQLEQASPSPRFQGIRLRTSGSGSSVGTWKPLRTAGATAREMLLTAASQKWGVDRRTCRAENSKVVHIPTRRTYGELSAAAAALPVPQKVPLKDPKDFRLIGKRVKRVDGAHIVQGRARAELPGVCLRRFAAKSPS